MPCGASKNLQDLSPRTAHIALQLQLQLHCRLHLNQIKGGIARVAPRRLHQAIFNTKEALDVLTPAANRRPHQKHASIPAMSRKTCPGNEGFGRSSLAYTSEEAML